MAGEDMRNVIRQEWHVWGFPNFEVAHRERAYSAAMPRALTGNEMMTASVRINFKEVLPCQFHRHFHRFWAWYIVSLEFREMRFELPQLAWCRETCSCQCPIGRLHQKVRKLQCSCCFEKARMAIFYFVELRKWWLFFTRALRWPTADTAAPPVASRIRWPLTVST